MPGVFYFTPLAALLIKIYHHSALIALEIMCCFWIMFSSKYSGFALWTYNLFTSS